MNLLCYTPSLISPLFPSLLLPRTLPLPHLSSTTSLTSPSPIPPLSLHTFLNSPYLSSLPSLPHLSIPSLTSSPLPSLPLHLVHCPPPTSTLPPLPLRHSHPLTSPPLPHLSSPVPPPPHQPSPSSPLLTSGCWRFSAEWSRCRFGGCWTVTVPCHSEWCRDENSSASPKRSYLLLWHCIKNKPDI